MKVQFRLLCISFVCSFLQHTNAHLRGGGTLKVRIGRFSNIYNTLANGNCCSVHQSYSWCQLTCRTFFRICASLSARTKLPTNLSLLHAGTDQFTLDNKFVSAKKNTFFRQSKQTNRYESLELTTADPARSNDIEDTPSYAFSSSKDEFSALRSAEGNNNKPFVPCSFGVVVTNVVVGSSLEAEKDGILEVDFPFKTPWPLSIDLVIEAWNEESSYSVHREKIAHLEGNQTGLLIARHESRHSIQGNKGWEPFRYDINDGMSIHYAIRVACKSPFFGHKCSMRCDNLRNSQNNRINCTDNGEVSCLEGWTGDMCNKAICREGCHSIHGYCTQPGECKCALGWRGKNCDECVPLPGCKHGFCINASYDCICEPGWEGPYCSTPSCSEGCHSARGYCELPGKCRCRLGWEGETCEICKPTPGCQNGFCIKPLECRCRPGWTGTLCNEPVCKSNCSIDHGACANPGECRCELGWWGEDCDKCFPYPGCEHGTCENPWECNCTPGWTGMTCGEIEESGRTSFCKDHSNICLNGGSCNTIPDERNYTCSCTAMFTGKNCEHLVISSQSSSAKRSTLSAFAPLSQNLKQHQFVTSPKLPIIADEHRKPSTSVSMSTSVSVSTSHDISSLTKPLIDSFVKTEERVLPEYTERKSSESFGNVEKIGSVFKQTLGSTDRLPSTATREDVSIELHEQQVPEALMIIDKKEAEEPELLFDIPAAEELYSAILKAVGIKLSGNDSSRPIIQAPMIVLQILDHTMDFDHQNVGRNLNADIASVDLHSERPIFSRYEDSVGFHMEDHRSFFPYSVVEEMPPISRFYSHPYFVSTNFIPSDQIPSLYSFEDYADQPLHTRINRRIGEDPEINSAPTSGILSKFSEDQKPLVEEISKSKEKRKAYPNSYYEENVNGRVHIGDVSAVDKDAPFEEIVEAFIDLKKL